MDELGADEWICKDHCSFFKSDRKETDRCRGYTLLCAITDQKAPPQLSKAAKPFDPSFETSFFYQHVCERCPFLIDGCDFTSPHPPNGCLPCGGLVLLSRLVNDGVLGESEIREADVIERRQESYLSLSPACSIKRLEQDAIYHIARDELYEVNEEGLEFLRSCNGGNRIKDLQPDPEFLDFCLSEDILRLSYEKKDIVIRDGRSPVPSLRYLEWLVTFRCNLKCSHCYLGGSESDDFPADLLHPLLDQFTDIQGLRILVSGGEPTLYRHFDLLNDAVARYPIRSVLLTNGQTLDDKTASKLNFHEVQISLDGMGHGHEALRGKGTFDRAVKAMHSVRQVGLDLSVASMIHRENLAEWDEMSKLIKDLGAREWNVDYPCVKGRWLAGSGSAVDLEEAAERMRYGFGGSYHGASSGWTCGRHLAAVLPSGIVCRCGLYPETVLGSVTEGLKQAWLRAAHIPISQTKCALCLHADSCGGGCRFRAGDGAERDDVMCRFFAR